MGHIFPNGEQAHIESLDEKGQPQDHQQTAEHDVSKVGQGLPQHHDLKESNDHYDGQQILEGSIEFLDDRPEGGFQPGKLLVGIHNVMSCR